MHVHTHAHIYCVQFACVLVISCAHSHVCCVRFFSTYDFHDRNDDKLVIVVSHQRAHKFIHAKTVGFRPGFRRSYDNITTIASRLVAAVPQIR